MSKVFVYDCPDYAAAGQRVGEALAKLAPPLAGRRVLIKPNILGPCPPEAHVTTHPSLVAAAVAFCREAGAAEIVVGDNSGMTAYGSGEQAARASGILDAADGCWRNIAERPRAVRGATPATDDLPVSRAVLEADVVLNLAKMKTHVATGITGAVKNTFGYVVGAAKTRLHALCPGEVRFSRAVLDVFAIRPPEVSLIDGIYAMEGQGPSGGRPRFVGRLIASTDAVAADVVMARIMGIDPADVPYLVGAGKRGLGQTDPARIETVGAPPEPVPGFRRPRLSMGAGAWVARLVSRLVTTQPRADRTACVRCGVCARQCPVEAIRMDPYPVVDAERCISCFCCHEFCNYKAMRLAPRLRLFKRLRGG